jgi:ADP-heptose:LPS heptosyltransferase
MQNRLKSLIYSILIFFEKLFFFVSKKRKLGGIALIRLDAIGDFLLWLDTAQEYRRLYPNQKITLIANTAWVDLAKQLPYWDEVLPVDIRHLYLRHPFKRWQLLWRISQRGFHIAIQPTFSRVLMHGDSVMRATGAKQRIGSRGDLANTTAEVYKTGNRWYTKLLPASPGQMMELLRNAEFFSQLSDTTHQSVLASLPRLAGRPSALLSAVPYFIVFPGASWVGRQWPVASFAAALLELQRSHGWQPVLCGAPNEAGICQAIANAAAINCINLAGQTTLSELAEVIRGARLLVGNETSAVHIAAAVGTPSVCILGGGHFGRFMPYPDNLLGIKPVVAAKYMDCYHCNWICSQSYDSNGPVPCIDNISVANVLSAAQQALLMSHTLHEIQAS